MKQKRGVTLIEFLMVLMVIAVFVGIIPLFMTHISRMIGLIGGTTFPTPNTMYTLTIVGAPITINGITYSTGSHEIPYPKNKQSSIINFPDGTCPISVSINNTTINFPSPSQYDDVNEFIEAFQDHILLAQEFIADPSTLQNIAFNLGNKCWNGMLVVGTGAQFVTTQPLYNSSHIFTVRLPDNNHSIVDVTYFTPSNLTGSPLTPVQDPDDENLYTITLDPITEIGLVVVTVTVMII